MRIILIVIGFILVNCFAQGQTTFLKDQQFVPIGGKFYGGNGVNQLSDSSYMVIGVEKTGLESSACFMAKYKPNGELAKVRHSLTDSPFFYVDFKSVTFLPDESFWTCATYYTSGFDTTQMANFHYDSEGNLLGSITQDGGYSRIIQINDSIMAGIFVYDSTDTNIYNPNKELHLLRFDGSLVLNTKIRGEDIYFNGQNLFLERRENDSLKWFRKIDLDSFNFLDSFSVVIDSVFGRFQFTKNEFIYIYYNYYYPDKTYFFGRNLNDYSKIWSGKNGYIEGEEFTTFDFSFNYSTYYNDSVYLRVALTKDGKGKTVIGKLKPNGLIELLNVNYRYTATQFTFYPKFKTLDNGFFGLASDHFSPSSNFKLMKTDSFGQVLNSDYMGGVTFKIDTSNTIKDVNRGLNKFFIFPNPTSSTLNISSLTNPELQYIIQNIGGQSLLEGQFQSSTQIDVSDFPNGMYFLQIKGEGISETRKVVISH